MSGSGEQIDVVAIGTLDTKGAEYRFLCDRLREHGVRVTLVDAGVLGEPPAEADVSRAEVAEAAGADIVSLAADMDRGAAIAAMARGAAEIVLRLHAAGELDAVIGLGGTGGSSLIAEAMRGLPVGVPKLLVSTVASGDTRPYVGAVDLTMMYSVVDISGLNTVSEAIIENAAAAVAGMAKAGSRASGARSQPEVPLLGASMFGVTTPCVTTAREYLEEKRYELLVFHQTGVGGQSMEELVSAGFISGVLDVTTTELADEMIGGVFPAHPQRIEVTAEAGIPMVVSVGALDMVNFGPPPTVPPRFEGRAFYQHNPAVTLMRTTAEECAALGSTLAAKLNLAKGPVALFLPLRGVSALSVAGQPFHDPDADEALFGALRSSISARVELHEHDSTINDPSFSIAMAERLQTMLEEEN